MDAISECEQVVRSKSQKEEEAPWRLFFRKELFSPWHDACYDDVSTNLIYQQIVKGIKSREYRFKMGPDPQNQDEDLAKYVAQIYYIECNGNIVAGKLQASLHNFVPSKYLQVTSPGISGSKGDAKSRDQWTQLIVNSIEEQQLTQKKLPAQGMKEDMVLRASNRWYLQFSGLFEAFKITGPALPKNDVVVAINHKGMYVMHEPFKVCTALEYCMIVEIFCSRTTKVRGQSFSIVTLKGDEYTFMSPNAQNIANLLSTFLEGLRRRSKYAVGIQQFIMHGSVVSNEPFSFRQGDTLEILETEPEGAPKKHEWVIGRNERTGQRGMFPLDMVYMIPSMEKPGESFFKIFTSMTAQETQTLPRRKGTVLLNQTISKTAKKKGKETAA